MSTFSINFCRFCFKLIIINSPNSEETGITCRISTLSRSMKFRTSRDFQRASIETRNLEPNTRTIRFEMLTKVFILLKKYQLIARNLKIFLNGASD
ncbi:hypothetical protein RIR_jg4111.t1 [Rhizophagus irregularis DAOM 181602=DAOM 197198]|nr:hypothetical protein RIR_jg4111.t1 [Rhizophagus irregularis DAOM 181602=DAOM 197198]